MGERDIEYVCVCGCVCEYGKTTEQTEAFCQHLNEYFLRKLFNWKLMAFEILSDALERPIGIKGICHTHTHIRAASYSLFPVSHFLMLIFYLMICEKCWRKVWGLMDCVRSGRFCKALAYGKCHYFIIIYGQFLRNFYHECLRSSITK